MIVLLLVASAAGLGYKTGDDLLQLCSQSRPACVGYVLGVADGFSNYRSNASLNGTYCIPSGVSGGQITNVVIKYLLDHPKDRHHLAASLVEVAFEKVFSC